MQRIGTKVCLIVNFSLQLSIDHAAIDGKPETDNQCRGVTQKESDRETLVQSGRILNTLHHHSNHKACYQNHTQY